MHAEDHHLVRGRLIYDRPDVTEENAWTRARSE
jgi:hypothetical protein